MSKTFTILVILLFGFAFNSNAHESDRIDQLKKEVQELNLRVSKLESLLRNPSSTPEVSMSNEGWKSISNWRKLTTEMGYREVREILGEPYQVEGGGIATWYYKNGGEVIFMGGEIYKWREPR